MTAAADPQTLPLWLQMFGFILSIILAGFKVIEFFRKPVLNIEVTRDVFFRLIDQGEALFCGPVLLARNGPVLVRHIRPLLSRVTSVQALSGAEKNFPLSVLFVGEKVHGTQLLADHKFFGSSPLQYLGPSQPFRAVYVCFQAEYQERQKRAVADFTNALEQFRADKATLIVENPDLVRNDFNALIDEHFHLMSGLIQLESGSYVLNLEVSYECVGWRFFGANKTINKKLEFKVAEQDLRRWKLDLRRLLFIRGQQSLTDTVGTVIFPELTPYEVREV